MRLREIIYEISYEISVASRIYQAISKHLGD